MRHFITVNRRRRLTLAFSLSTLVAAGVDSVQAQTVATFQELGTVVRVGDSVLVRDQQGQQTAGVVSELSPSALRVRIDGATREWVAGDVTEVRRRGDSLVNGALWGLAIGGGVAGLWGGATFALCANEGGRNCPQLKVLSTFTPIAAGLGIGLLVDALRSGDTLVFGRRNGLIVAPAVDGHGSYGGVLAVRF